MNTIDHALMEFRAAGWADEDLNFKDELQAAICEDVLQLLRVFAEQGHSGTSACYVIDLFTKLANHEPIVPLTGEDWEWTEICDERTGGVSVFQNKRCSHVFRQRDRFDGQAYDIDAVVFYDWLTDEETGERFKSYFTSSNSHRPITFPYVPKSEYAERIE